MSAMYRFKAYFGMVPAEDLVDYVDDDPEERYAPPRRAERSQYASEQVWEERSSGRWADDERDVHDDERERRVVRAAAVERPVTTVREHVRATGMSAAQSAGGGATPIRGALAMEPDVREFSLREAPAREALPAAPAAASVPEQRDRTASALSRIVTLQPSSYTEARAIGERFRDGVPVIMNLTELDTAAAKRLVDFAAGLAFALRGGFDKVTNRVFLLTPADVEVSADDARMLAKRSVNSHVGAARVDAERPIFRQD